MKNIKTSQWRIEFNIQFNLKDPELFLDAGKTDTISKSWIEPDDIKIRMYLCLLRLNDDVFRGLMATINTKHQIAVYPTLRTEIRDYPSQAGLWRLQIDNPFQYRF